MPFTTPQMDIENSKVCDGWRRNCTN